MHNTYYYRNSNESCSSDTDKACSVTGNEYWWMMSPYSQYFMWYIIGASYPGRLSYTNLNNALTVRPVISIASDVLVTGAGTVNDPYVIER